jgi:hypothetical protein
MFTVSRWEINIKMLVKEEEIRKGIEMYPQEKQKEKTGLEGNGIQQS